MSTPDRRTQILDLAQSMIQERGYNAFSFRDLAREVGIKTASVHYHFPSKGELGEQVMHRYLEGLESKLAEWERLPSHRPRLEAFIASYRDTGARGAVCLCGSMASDIQTLDGPIRAPIQRYLERSSAWVSQQIRGGQAAGEFRSEAQADGVAKGLVAGLQGALILSRAQADDALLDSVEQGFFAQLEP